MFQYSENKDSLVYVGRKGDMVDYKELPPSMQTEAMAEAVGAIGVVSSEPFEACGSPGEVANVPRHGHLFHSWLARDEAAGDELHYDYRYFDGKRMVHSMISLYAEDQLRQRVAWALAQIFVVSEAGLNGHKDEQEIWHTYYDIFVRHAFG
eukprot:2416685-Pleurochrysis_carterae.AAC.1